MTTDGSDLYPGERVLWQGAPVRFPVFYRSDWGALLFLVVGLAIVGAWVAVVHAAQQRTMTWFGLIFGLFVLVRTVAGFARRALVLRRIRYVVTDQRLIVSWTLRGHRERSYALADLAPPMLAGRTGEDSMVGTISFGSTTHRSPDGMFLPAASLNALPPVITEVPAPRQVRDIIAAAQTGMRRSPGRPAGGPPAQHWHHTDGAGAF